MKPIVLAEGMAPTDFSNMIAPQFVATHSFADAPKLDILIVPGGVGFRSLIENNDTSVETFVQSRFPDVEYILSVCTGAAFLARAGVLKGKRATTNKAAWDLVLKYSEGSGANWVPNARWTEDGKVWTSSGISSGIDMAAAFFKMFYGEERVNWTLNDMEYAPHTDPNDDPFAIVHNVTGADMSRPLRTCALPAGFQ
ncbi:hypothetical protein ABW20_dc0102309 [Dactylellina cionopaga]|nr:hypothetical protein ABW20_dc0102309 [Dactylellina cionopaga]